jgi:hypothetical protein
MVYLRTHPVDHAHTYDDCHDKTAFRVPNPPPVLDMPTRRDRCDDDEDGGTMSAMLLRPHGYPH